MRFTMTLAVAAAALATALPALAGPYDTSGKSDQSAQSAPAEQSAPSAESRSSAASTMAPSATTLAVGQTVKDKTGAVIGEISELKPGPSGQAATVKMGDQSFVIGADSLVVQDGAAVINATQAELREMIAKAGAPG